MKNKNISKWIVFTLGIFITLCTNSQCTPDSSITSLGIFPKTLNSGCVNSFYDQTLTVVIPRDTTLTLTSPPITINVALDSARILAVNNLPSGLTYSCYSSSCKAYIGNGQDYL